MPSAIADLVALAAQYDQSLPPAPPLPAPPLGAAIAGWIDHTLLKPEATPEMVQTLCAEARQYHFASVCINPCYVPLASGLLAGSGVPVCTVVGFPLGATLPAQKVMETLTSLGAGASEIDMVLNIGALKGGAYGQVLNEIAAVVMTAHNQRAIVKVILETSALTRREKILACLLAREAEADFVKTSTGFGAGGATVADVDLMFRVVGADLAVKASGGIRSLADSQALIAAGATRLGASAGVKIVQEVNNEEAKSYG
jgi:deoxyribose-phosphate aldolase